MAIQRLDNVAVVVEDLDEAVAFFTELGMELEGRMPVDSEWAGRVVGLEGMRSEIAMMRVPGGHGRLELTRYVTPVPVDAGLQHAPPNTLGLHRVMFAVDDVRETVERLRGHGGELLGEIVRYEDAYLLCYLRGPSGIVVALAEELS
ncbi:VOC family protein [Cellulosimicrobium sp. NPDC057127]|uniref:VOC family protein n=1 Tax=Cellulosimicrobium sp. NPDC057127 TaxID=3346026 RepID=UPI0036392154